MGWKRCRGLGREGGPHHGDGVWQPRRNKESAGGEARKWRMRRGYETGDHERRRRTTAGAAAGRGGSCGDKQQWPLRVAAGSARPRRPASGPVARRPTARRQRGADDVGGAEEGERGGDEPTPPTASDGGGRVRRVRRAPARARAGAPGGSGGGRHPPQRARARAVGRRWGPPLRGTRRMLRAWLAPRGASTAVRGRRIGCGLGRLAAVRIVGGSTPPARGPACAQCAVL